MPRAIRGERFDLEPRHIDAGRALALAALAGDARLECRVHRVAGQVFLAQLTGEREPQRVGSPARGVLLVVSDPIARAHRSCVELAAVPVVVAHFDRLGEATGFVATGSRSALATGQRIAIDVP